MCWLLLPWVSVFLSNTCNWHEWACVSCLFLCCNLVRACPCSRPLSCKFQALVECQCRSLSAVSCSANPSARWVGNVMPHDLVRVTSLLSAANISSKGTTSSLNFSLLSELRPADRVPCVLAFQIFTNNNIRSHAHVRPRRWIVSVHVVHSRI